MADLEFTDAFLSDYIEHIPGKINARRIHTINAYLPAELNDLWVVTFCKGISGEVYRETIRLHDNKGNIIFLGGAKKITLQNNGKVTQVTAHQVEKLSVTQPGDYRIDVLVNEEVLYSKKFIVKQK